MIILYFISILLAFLYIFLISGILGSWNEIEEWEYNEQFQPDTSFTIIVPFRNEQNSIQDCLKSILANSFPKRQFEIIAIDDFSDDHSKAIMEEFEYQNVSLISLADFGIQAEQPNKKAAIQIGVELANNPWIITIDADCVVDKNWLKSIASYIEYNNYDLIAGMVSVQAEQRSIESFQALETCGTMGIHAFGIRSKQFYLANGANLIYKKELFQSISPYEENKSKASGDDIYLINEVAKRDPQKIGFLKCKKAIVKTGSEKNWGNLIRQRKRWASKQSSGKKERYQWLAGFVWIFNISIIMNLFLIPFFGGISLFILITQLFIKAIMDFLYLKNMSDYFDQKTHLKRFFQSFFIYIIVILLSGYWAIVGGKYEWKGRKTR